MKTSMVILFLLFSFCLFVYNIFRIVRFSAFFIPAVLAFFVVSILAGWLLTKKFLNKSGLFIFALEVTLILAFLNFTICLRTFDLSPSFLLNQKNIFKDIIHFILGIVLFLPYFFVSGILTHHIANFSFKEFKKRSFFYWIAISGIIFSCSAVYLLFGLFGIIKISLLAIISLQFVRIFAYDTGIKNLFKITFLIIFYLLSTVYSFEDKFIFFIQNNQPYSAKSLLSKKIRDGKKDFDFLNRSEILAQRWTKKCHLMLLQSGNILYGMYNGKIKWVYHSHFDMQLTIENSFESMPFKLMAKDSSVALIGAGGGMQVKEALFYKPNEIVAIDDISELFDLLRNECPESNEGVYLNEKVHCFAADWKEYLNKTDKYFDLIYFYNINPVNLLGQFKKIKNRLKEEGIVAIIDKADLERNPNLSKRLFKEMKNCNIMTHGYLGRKAGFSKEVFLIIGYKDCLRNAILLKEIEGKLRNQGYNLKNYCDEKSGL